MQPDRMGYWGEHDSEDRGSNSLCHGPGAYVSGASSQGQDWRYVSLGEETMTTQRVMRATAGILLGLELSVSFGAGPPLERLGRPLVVTNCEIIWKAPTNGWPSSISVYR